MQHERFRQPLMVQHNAQMRIIIVGGKLYSLREKDAGHHLPKS